MPNKTYSTHTQASIKEHAASIGNKAANLQELKKIAPAHIPHFCPLSDAVIQAHLNKHAAHWTSLWREFQTAQGNEKSAICATAIPILHSLRELITSSFSLNPIDNPEILVFLESMQRNHASLMVRSTGEEDSIDLANPGGNESVAAVAPNIAAVSTAMGRVVASYFSEKSLKQRLLSSVSDITKAVFVPVLLQQMIGEPLHGAKYSHDVVRSGVMYTDDGITRIQVAPGHGELVVNSKGLFDTYSITR
ncbi:MAG: PEP/pyruvate-binding domain-containing protein [Legionellales bacterium]